MEFHEAANIFPLDEEHIDDLAADIREHGLQLNIELLDGKILDGRRRWLACEKAGVKPKFSHVNPPDPVAYVLSLNLHRRHLSPTQLAMVGARARAWYDERAKERMREGGSRGGKLKGKANLPEPSKKNETQARDDVGKAVGVSGRSIDDATRVLNHGTPKLIAAVEADQIAVSTAARAATLSDAEKDALAERAAENAKKGVRRPRPVAENGEPDSEPEPDPDNNPGDRKSRGKGVALAHEAINCLSRIPKNDALRKRGFQLVTDWIRRNK